MNHITEGGIPVLLMVHHRFLSAIKFIDPNQVNSHLNVSVAKIQAIGSLSINTRRPGT